MAKIKKQSISELSEKARTARAYANDKASRKYNWSEGILEETAMNLSRGKAKGAEKIFGRYATPEEKKAARLMQNQRATELTRSETRAKGVTNRAAKKAAAQKTTKALTGVARSTKVKTATANRAKVSAKAKKKK